MYQSIRQKLGNIIPPWFTLEQENGGDTIPSQVRHHLARLARKGKNIDVTARHPMMPFMENEI